MTFETWLLLNQRPGESVEDAKKRYADEMGISDPAEREGFVQQLRPESYSFKAQDINIPFTQTIDTPSPDPEEQYIDDPDFIDQLKAGGYEAGAGIADFVGGPMAGWMPEEYEGYIRDAAEEWGAEQQRKADLVARPKTREQILEEDPDSLYQYLPEYWPTGHELARSAPPSLTPAAVGLGTSLIGTPLLGAAGLTGLGLMAGSSALAMTAGNLASSAYVSGEAYSRAQEDETVRLALGVSTHLPYKDLPEQEKRIVQEFAEDASQTSFGHRLYTSGLLEMMSFARFGKPLFRWMADMGLGATSEVWDNYLYAEDITDTLAEYGIPKDKAEEMRLAILNLGPSDKELWTKSLVQEGLYGAGFTTFESMVADTRVDAPKTSTKKQQELKADFIKRYNETLAKSDEQRLLGTDTQQRKRDAQDAVARESGFESWEQMEATNKANIAELRRLANNRTLEAREAALRRANEVEEKAEISRIKQEQEKNAKEVLEMERAAEESIRLARTDDYAATRKALEKERQVLDNIAARLPKRDLPVRKDGTLLSAEEMAEANALRIRRERNLMEYKKRLAALEKAEKKFRKRTDPALMTAEQRLEEKESIKKEAKKQVKKRVLKSAVTGAIEGGVSVPKARLETLFRKFQPKKDIKYVVLDKNDTNRLANILGGPEYLADAQGYLSDSEAFIIQGEDKVYLVADNIRGETIDDAIGRAVEVGVFHEPIAHLGMRKTLGDKEFDSFLDRFYETNMQDINEWAVTEVTPENVPAYLDKDYDPEKLKRPGLRQRLGLKKKVDTELTTEKKRELAEEYLAHKFTEYGVRDPDIIERTTDALSTYFSSILGKDRASKVKAREMLASVQREYLGGKRNIITGDLFDPSNWVKSKPLAVVEEEKPEEKELTQKEKVKEYQEYLRKTKAKADVTEVAGEELLTEDVTAAKKAKGVRASKRRMTLREAQAWAAKPENQKGKGRRPRVPELQAIAERLRKGQATYEEYQEAVDKYLPIRKFETIPTPATEEEILGSINTRKYKEGLLVREANLGIDKEGNSIDEMVDVRLDIPAYEKFDTWVPTISRYPRKGTPKIYGSTAHLEDVTFKAPLPTAALEVAEGETKTPFATMRGIWKGTSDSDLKKLADVMKNKSAWIQIGYNPEVQSSFYIKETKGKFTKGTPLASADEVIQIGGFVLAKNPVTKAVPTQVVDGKTIRFAKQKIKAYGGTAQVEENVIAALKSDSRVRPLIEYMTAEELDMLKPENVDRMIDVVRARLGEGDFGITRIPGQTGTKLGDLVSMALAGRIKKGWYINSMGTIKTVFGKDATRFTALLSALSPRTSVESNAFNAVSVWVNWNKAGRPTDRKSILDIMENSVEKGVATSGSSILPTWIPNSIRALATTDPDNLVLSGAKVNSFLQNLLGNLDEVTNDAWMWKAYGIVDSSIKNIKRKLPGDVIGTPVELKTPEYIIASASARRAANFLTEKTGETWKPAEVQETVWSFIKALTEKGEGDPRTLERIAVEDDLSGIIAEVPDFDILISGDKLGKILIKGGYEKQIKQLSARPNVTQAKKGITASNRVRRIGKIAKRIGDQIPLQRGEKKSADALKNLRELDKQLDKQVKRAQKDLRKVLKRVRHSKRSKQWDKENKGFEGAMKPYETSYLEWAEQWFNFGPGNKPHINEVEDLIGIALVDFEIQKAMLTQEINNYLPPNEDVKVGWMDDTTHRISAYRNYYTNRKVPEAFEAYKKYKIENFKKDKSIQGSGAPWYTLSKDPISVKSKTEPSSFELWLGYDEVLNKVFSGKPLPMRIENLQRHIEYAMANPHVLENNDILRETFIENARGTSPLPAHYWLDDDGKLTQKAREHIAELDSTHIEDAPWEGGDVGNLATVYHWKIQEQHEEIHKANAEYLELQHENADGTGLDFLFNSAMMRALNLKTGKAEINPPPEIVGNGRALGHVFNRFKNGEYATLKHLHNDFVETVRLHTEEAMREAKLAGEPVLLADGGKWIESPMVTKEHKGTDKEEEIYKFWREHAHKSWCWYEDGYEKRYAPKGPVFVYEKNGKFLLGLRFEYGMSHKSEADGGVPSTAEMAIRGLNFKRELVEVQSQLNNNTIPAEMADAVHKFIKAKEEELGTKLELGYQAKGVVETATEGMNILKNIEQHFAEKSKWKARDEKTYGRINQRMYLRELNNGKGYAARWDSERISSRAGNKKINPWLIPDQDKFPIEILAENTTWNVESTNEGAEKHLRIAGGNLKYTGELVRQAILGPSVGLKEVLPNLNTVLGQFYIGQNSDLLSQDIAQGDVSEKDLKKGKRRIELKKLSTVDSLVLENSIDLPGVIAVPGYINLMGNSSVENLETAGKVLIIRGQDGDENFSKHTVTRGLPNLDNIDTNFIYSVTHKNISHATGRVPESHPPIDFNKLSTIGEDMVLSPRIDDYDFEFNNLSAKYLQFKGLHSIGGDLLHGRGDEMNPDFPNLYSIVGDSKINQRWISNPEKSEISKRDWLERFGNNGYSAPNLTLVGGDIEVYANSYLPNLQRVGKDIHIYIDAIRVTDNNENLSIVKELLPNLTHVGGDIIIHLKEDAKANPKRFLHIDGRISTLSWDRVSENGYEIQKVYDYDGNIVDKDSNELQKLKTEKELADSQEGYIGWNQIMRMDIDDVKDQGLHHIKNGQQTKIQTLTNIAPNLKFIGSNQYNQRTYKGRQQISIGDNTDPAVVDYIKRMKTYWEKKGGVGVHQKPATSRQFRHLFGEALKDTDLDPRTQRLIRFSRMVRRPTAKELEAEWRGRTKVKPASELPRKMGVNINDKTQDFTGQILSGRKTMETRDTDSLRKYVGSEVGIVSTGKGPAQLVGYMTVGEPVVYNNRAEFKKDQSKHLVKTGSNYDIKRGKVKYGYPLTNVRRVTAKPVTSRGIVARKLGDKVTISKEARAIYDAKPTRKDLTPEAILNPRGNVRSSKVLMSRVAKHAIDTRSWNPFTRWTQATQPFADRLTKRLVSQGTLPDSAQYKALRRRVKGIITSAETAGKKLYDALKKSKQKDLIFKYLTTKGFDPNKISNLNERQAAISAKKRINEIGDMLVERKLMKQKTKELHEGEYLPRVYLKYLLGEENFRKASTKGGLGLDLSYLIGRKDIPEGIRKLILGEIKDPGYLASKAVAVPQKDIAIIDWLKSIAGNKNWVLPASLVQYDVLGKMKSFTASVDLQKQLELVDTEGSPVSAYWLANESDRILKQSQLLDISEAETKMVKKLTMDMRKKAEAQMEKTQGKIDPKLYSQVPATPKFGQLAGMVVRKEIAQDIFGSMNMQTGDISLAESVFGDGGKIGDYNRLWKWSKVSANPPSWVRNFISNLTLMNLGDVPFYRMPGLMLSSLADMRKMGKHRGKLHQLSKDLGLTAGNFSNAELGRIETEFKDLMQRMSAKEKSGMRVLGPIKGAFNVLRDSTSDFYGGIDSLGKMMMLKYKMEKAGLKIKDYGAYSDAELAKLNDAAYDAEKYLFDYSNPLPSVKWVRQAPFGAPFMSFVSFVLPIVMETIITKPWKFLPYYVLGWSAKELFKSEHDLDEEKYKGLRVSMSDYLREKAEGAGPYPVIPWPYLDENGRVQFIDVSYLYPWGMFSEVLGEMFDGNFGKAMRTAGLMGSPTLTVASAIMSGRDSFTRQPIVDDFGTWDEQAADIGWFAFNLTMPPMLHGVGQGPGQGYGAWKRVYEAVTGQLTKEGEARFTLPQALARLGGINITPIAVPEGRNKQLRYEYSRLQKLQRLAKRDLTNMLVMQEDAEDIREAALDYREKIQNLANEFKEKVGKSAPPITLLRQREQALRKMRQRLLQEKKA